MANIKFEFFIKTLLDKVILIVEKSENKKHYGFYLNHSAFYLR